MPLKSFSFDAKKTIYGKFKPSTRAEREFYKSLRKIAKASSGIIDSHTDGVEIKNSHEMQKALEQYSKRLEPWAKRQAAKMLAQVQHSNKLAYKNKSKALGRGLSTELQETETGLTAMNMMVEQVNLIKSIPTEAGLRAQEIALKASVEGKRATPDQSVIDQLQKELGMTEEVATNRAKLIARTETARATAHINQSRAMQSGSRFYRWHNSGDEAVRHSHKYLGGKKLQGMIFSWDSPPTLDDGMTGHPGTFPNCRCFAEPIFDDE